MDFLPFPASLSDVLASVFLTICGGRDMWPGDVGWPLHIFARVCGLLVIGSDAWRRLSWQVKGFRRQNWLWKSSRRIFASSHPVYAVVEPLCQKTPSIVVRVFSTRYPEFQSNSARLSNDFAVFNGIMNLLVHVTCKCASRHVSCMQAQAQPIR